LRLYYLRARYYNPLTGRFLSRDPENGKPIDPKTLHKYLYAGGDPVNRIDPKGREDQITYADIDAHSELTTTRVANTFGCVSSILFTSASLLITDKLGGLDAAGAGATYYGCVSLVLPTPTSLGGILLKGTADYATCGIAIAQVVHDLNEAAANPNESSAQVNVDGLGAIVGCVTTQLSMMLDADGEAGLTSLGLL
jgi:hypothetical protein